MIMKTIVSHLCALAIFAFASIQSGLVAQEKSVNPGINKSFQKPEVSNFVERFEKEGREVYDNREEIINACQLRPAMVVADVGAGTGLFTRLLSPKVSKVIAVDIAQEFLTHIKKSAKKEGFKNIETVQCKSDSAELPANSVDLVFVCDTYHHFEFPYKTMRSIRKALKPNGTLVLVEFDRIQGKSSEWIMGHVRADRETFTNEIETAGFQEIEERDEFFKTSYLKRFKKSERIVKSGHTQDTFDEIKKLVENETAIILDVREQREWDSGHLKNATLLPNSKIPAMLKDEASLSKILPKDKIIYCHCAAGYRALKATKSLVEKGYDVRALQAGYSKLVKEGFEKE